TDSPKYAEQGGKLFETSVGRLLFNAILPRDYPFINDEIKHKMMMALVDDLVKRYGLPAIPDIVDKIKGFGFRYVTHSGITWSISDVKVPAGKEQVVNEARHHEDEIAEQFNEGLLSVDERRREIIEIWLGAKNEVEKLIPDALEKNGPVYDMWQSGARGSLNQITQMAGMKGLIQNTAGETIEFPIIASMKEGLTPIEYFITTHGARKGLSDTALNTAKAGYLTRRLFDVAQDAIVVEDDCGEKEGIIIRKESASGIEVSLAKAVKGRFLTQDVEEGGKTIFKKGHFVTADDAKKIEGAGAVQVAVRSPMTCKTLHGICQHCYGMDLTTNEVVDLGEAVGTVAAQAIGEPGTQLTMRTFHSGGTASVGGDITRGLPRVEEVFEKRMPKNPALVAQTAGTVSEVRDDGKEKVITLLPDAGQKKSKKTFEYLVHFRRVPLVKVGDHVDEGDILTDGSADLDELFEHAGREKTQEYIIAEISRIYELQGASISRKHIEVIIKQLFSRRKIKDPGQTRFSVGDIIEDFEFASVNRAAKDAEREVAVGESVVLGISDVALSRKSFLSSASFQNTTKVLIAAAVKGAEDELIGLKENVIIGHLIPAGTGFKGSKKAAMIGDARSHSLQATHQGMVSQETVRP
ncbi:MAG TPA: DNA-directed RNA polymerase subunit beta', partial [Candidatus Paceibacterota bacterium]